MIDFRLYLISDRRLTWRGLNESTRSECDALVAAIETACRAGVRAVQLREKDLNTRALYETACRIRGVTRDHQAKFFVNDRVDVAMASAADGVHCPDRGFPAADAARMLGSRRSVGVSTHSLERAQRAQRDGADFITFGPVFTTPSKKVFGPPQGLQALKNVAGAVTIPVLAIGGITPERTAHCLDHGASGVALISSILALDDIARAVDRFAEVMGSL